jgi:hypothetical protein
MRSANLRYGHCFLMAAVLLAPVLVQPQGLEFEDNDWIASGSKRHAVSKSKTVVSPVINDPTIDRSLKLLNDGTDLSAVATIIPDGSTSGEDSHWMWAIVASLCVAGAGLACFSYYWLNMRRATSW